MRYIASRNSLSSIERFSLAKFFQQIVSLFAEAGVQFVKPLILVG
jgi:hypothetical protein